MTKKSIKNGNREIKQKLTEDKLVLKKSIGLLQAVSIIVGIIIGSGIFVSPIGVLKYTNSVGMSFIMWVICGIFSTLGAMVYAELGVTIPRSGGEYIYVLNSFGPLAAFVCMWISFVTIGSVSLAANSLIFAQYILQPFFNDCFIPKGLLIIIAVLGISTLMAINCYNVKLAAKMAVFFTICKIFALMIIVGIGSYNMILGRFSNFVNAFDDSNTSPGSLALAFYQGFWAYAGWNYLNFLTDEMDNPSRNLPIAIILSLSLVTFIYVTVNIAYLAVLSPFEMVNIGSGSVAIAVVFAQRTMGYFSCVMPVFVGASVFGSMNGEFLSISRLTFAAAKEGHMPQCLAMVSIKCVTPMPSIIFLAILSISFALFPNIFYLIELSGFAFCIISGMAVTCLIYLRIKRPELPRPFKLPLALPIIFLTLDVFIGLLTIQESPRESLISIILMIVAIPIYIFFITWKTKPKSITNLTDYLTIFIQKTLLVVAEESK